MSAISLYMTFFVYAMPKSVTLNISADTPVDPIAMRVISDQDFEDQDVPLDGHTYERCTFKNVCFLYNGVRCGQFNCPSPVEGMREGPTSRQLF
jgi:hypothetical protein